MSDFIYIDPDNIGYTARDADILTELNFGNLFPGSSNTAKFRLGNTGSSDLNFITSGTTVNSGVLDNISISTDGESYSSISSGVVTSLSPNEISDDIFIKYDVPVDTYINEGTFRLDTSIYSGDL